MSNLTKDDTLLLDSLVSHLIEQGCAKTVLKDYNYIDEEYSDTWSHSDGGVSVEKRVTITLDKEQLLKFKMTGKIL